MICGEIVKKFAKIVSFLTIFNGVQHLIPKKHKLSYLSYLLRIFLKKGFK